MSSLRDQIYTPASADPTLLAMLGVGAGVNAGVACLLGADNTALPPGPATPWLYLEMDAEVQSTAPLVVDGLFRWRAYDVPHAGYTRLRNIVGRLLTIYPADPEYVWRDSVTREVLTWRGAGVIGPEFLDLSTGLNQQWITFPYRKGHPSF